MRFVALVVLRWGRAAMGDAQHWWQAVVAKVLRLSVYLMFVYYRCCIGIYVHQPLFFDVCGIILSVV